jgi:cytochrome d ubiquinol oxidase subunit I
MWCDDIDICHETVRLWWNRFGPLFAADIRRQWVTTESGRQPFTIFHLLRTGQSVSPLAAPAVATSLIAFEIVYFAVFGTGTASIRPHTAHGTARSSRHPRAQ